MSTLHMERVDVHQGSNELTNSLEPKVVPGVSDSTST